MKSMSRLSGVFARYLPLAGITLSWMMGCGGDDAVRAPMPGELIVSELVINVEGEDEGREWFEVYNASGSPLQLMGVGVLDESSGKDHIISESMVIQPGEFVLMAPGLEASAVAEPDVAVYLYDDVALGNDSDGIVLFVGETVIDRVAWDRAAYWPVEVDMAMSLDADHLNAVANDTAGNWCVAEQPTPGRANPGCPEDVAVEPTPGDLVISEVMREPLGSGVEWFELHNVTDHAVQLDQLLLVDGDGGIHEVRESGLAVPAGGYALFAQHDQSDEFMAGTLLYEYGQALSLHRSEDELTVSFDGVLIDALRYEKEVEWPRAEGHSLALDPTRMTITDNDDGLNWCLADAAYGPYQNLGSPGRANTACPYTDEYRYPDDGELVITEVMVDPTGDDTRGEWIEVYSRADAPLRLSGLTLRDAGGDGVTVDAPGLAVEPGQYAVFAQSEELLASVPAGTVGHAYGDGLRFSGTADTIELRFDGDTVAALSYDAQAQWPVRSGYAMVLNPLALAEERGDAPLDWCVATPDPDGTPGADNGDCPFSTENEPLVDNPQAYEQDQLAPVVMHLEMDPSELAELENVWSIDADVGPFPARVQVEEFGAGAGAANATIEVRGATSVFAYQKSWKIRLDDGNFRGQSILHLNKHPYDLTRIRNQVAFHLMRDIPDLSSLRTQFVHLYINGEDHGLFTQVEHMGHRYMRSHGLDDRGWLYKAKLFSYDEVTDEERVAGVVDGLELKAGAGFEHIIAMLDAVNDTSIPIDDVIATHFNRDNLITFYATLYLLMNVDSDSQNFYLYASPYEPARFYLLPWDFDGALDWYGQNGFVVERWREGLSNWWSQPLFARFIAEPANLADLLSRITALQSNYYDAATVDGLVDMLDAAATPLVNAAPDALPENLPPGDRPAEIDRLRGVVARRYVDLLSNIERPMPQWTWGFDIDPDNHHFGWSSIVDLQGDVTTAEVVLSNGPCGTDVKGCFDPQYIVASFPDNAGTSVTLTTQDLSFLPSGTYYWMTYGWDEHGNYQAPFAQFRPKTITLP